MCWFLPLLRKLEVSMDKDKYLLALKKVLATMLPAVTNAFLKEFTSDLQEADTARRGRAKDIASHKEMVDFLKTKQSSQS